MCAAARAQHTRALPAIESPTSPDSVKSRAGYILEVANCPIFWVPKLQPTIATSTMEAEHTALPVPLRAAIPLLGLAKQAAAGLGSSSRRALAFQAAAR